MPLLNIFANFFIDTEERFLRMQDSFLSFKDISASKWVINVRGRYSEKALIFLHANLGEKLLPYRLHSDEGWFCDSRRMLPEIDGDYVLFWLEDHINLARIELLDAIIHEMKEKDLEYLLYSFWQFGKLRSRYKGVMLTAGEYLDYFVHDDRNNQLIQQNGKGSYLIAAPSVFKRSLFEKVVLADDPIPKRWPKETPFDFEKAPTDVHWLPIKVALPRQELFASIDDDHGYEFSCLQSRGLYPIREERKSYTSVSTAETGKVTLLANLRYRYAVARQIIPHLLHLGSSTSQRKHIVRWMKLRRRNSLFNAQFPWLTFDAIDFVQSHLAINVRVFEFGSGGSTLYFLRQGAEVVAVEHDIGWYHFVRTKIGIGRPIDFRLIRPELVPEGNEADPADPDGYKSSDERYFACSFRNYVNQVDEFPDEHFDLILVDGRARPSCIKHAARKVKVGGFLVLDDSERTYYLELAGAFLRDFECKVFRGAKPGYLQFAETSVFTRKA